MLQATIALVCTICTFAVAKKPAMYIFGDIHYDPFYGTSTAVGPCNTSDAPSLGALQCDTSPALLESAIADIFSQADEDGDGIFLLTGDFVRHKLVDFAIPGENGTARHKVEYDLVYNITSTIGALIQKYSSQQKRKGSLRIVTHQNAFSLVDGNEDCVPHYEFYASLEPSIHPALQRLTAALTQHELLSETDGAQFQRCAFFSKVLQGTNLKIIALNTIIYSVQHRPNTSTEPDPCGQIAWLNNELASALAANQRVMILGHIIPDVTKWYSTYLDAYRSAMMNYNDIISAQWFGHTHMFTFLTLSQHKSPILIDVPAITPRDGNMPSYIKVTFTDQSADGPLNSSTWTVDDIHERYLDITSSSPSAWQDGLKFPGDFSAYLSKPLTTDELYQYGVSLLTDSKDSSAWDLFQQLYFGGVVQTALSKKDKADVLCKALAVSEGDYEKCKKDYK